VSDLAVTEIISALAHRPRQGSLAREAARRLQHAILGRLDEGMYHRVELTSARAASLASFDARLAAAARAVGLAVYPAC